MTDHSENFFHFWGKAAPLTGNTNERSYHLLAYHCLDVAAVGQQLLLHDPNLLRKIIPSDVFTDEPEREQWCVGIITFFLALHDIGKFSDRFQNLIPELMNELKGYTHDHRYAVRHTEMGQFFFDKVLWKTIWTQNWFELDTQEDITDWKDIWGMWASAVTGHHGSPPRKSAYSDYLFSDLFTDENQESALQFSKECAELFLAKRNSPLPLEYTPLFSSFCKTSWLLAGLAVLSDWIASNNVLFSYHSTPMPLEKYWKEYAVPHAEEAIRAFGIIPGTASPKTGMTALFPDFLMPTPLQSFAETCEISPMPQLFIVEEATGSGKTETALVLAHRLMAQGQGEGIYFGLPTMATANTMYDRMGKAYGRMFTPDSHPSLVLAHSGSKLSEKFRHSIGYPSLVANEQEYPGDTNASAQCNAWLSDNRKKALLAHVGVGTIDQALIAVLPLHHQSLRLLGLSRNILIVDEVHAYDPYVQRVLETLLEFHAALGGSAILLSATLPQGQRQALISAYASGLGIDCSGVRQSHYPMVTHVTPQTKEPEEYPIQICEMTHRTVEVECTDDPDIILKHLTKTVEEGRCACWVKNTVDDAVETYRTLSKLFGDENVLLFHARFTMGDRIKKENEVLELFGKDSTPKIRKGKILVATQVVEQSLDLDFDLMVTDLAPMDLIIQRSGRLHRHNDPVKRGNRGVPRLVVFCPQFSENPAYEWYSTLFPKGAYVYPNHGKLWLTARLLATRKHITMPDDARLLIEGTYGDAAQRDIPKSLTSHEIKADGKNAAEEAIAQLNVLDLHTGYKDTPNSWQDDTRTPTRLGDVQVQVLFLKWENSSLHFFSPDSVFPEEFSQVSMSDRKISKEFSHTGDLAAALDRFKATLADKGRWRILVPLEENNNLWQGRALDKNDKVVSVLYDSKLGVLITKS